MQLTFFNDTKSWMDHKDNIRTNNMLTNLRIATSYENRRNTKKKKGTSSKYIGVCKFRNKWQAQIVLNKKPKYLGMFINEKDAAIAYDNAVKKYRPNTTEFNLLNFK